METKFIKVHHDGKSHFVALYTGLHPLELSNLLQAVFSFTKHVTGLADVESGVLIPLSLACRSPETLSSDLHTLLLSDRDVHGRLSDAKNQQQQRGGIGLLNGVAAAVNGGAAGRRSADDDDDDDDDDEEEGTNEEEYEDEEGGGQAARRRFELARKVARQVELLKSKTGQCTNSEAQRKGGGGGGGEDDGDNDDDDDDNDGDGEDDAVDDQAEGGSEAEIPEAVGNIAGKIRVFADLMVDRQLLSPEERASVEEAISEGARVISAAYAVALADQDQEYLAALLKDIATRRITAEGMTSLHMQEELLKVANAFMTGGGGGGAADNKMRAAVSANGRRAPLDASQHLYLCNLILVRSDMVVEAYSRAAFDLHNPKGRARLSSDLRTIATSLGGGYGGGEGARGGGGDDGGVDDGVDGGMMDEEVIETMHGTVLGLAQRGLLRPEEACLLAELVLLSNEVVVAAYELFAEDGKLEELVDTLRRCARIEGRKRAASAAALASSLSPPPPSSPPPPPPQRRSPPPPPPPPAVATTAKATSITTTATAGGARRQFTAATVVKEVLAAMGVRNIWAGRVPDVFLSLVWSTAKERIITKWQATLLCNAFVKQAQDEEGEASDGDNGAAAAAAGGGKKLGGEVDDETDDDDPSAGLLAASKMVRCAWDVFQIERDGLDLVDTLVRIARMATNENDYPTGAGHRGEGIGVPLRSAEDGERLRSPGASGGGDGTASNDMVVNIHRMMQICVGALLEDGRLNDAQAACLMDPSPKGYAVIMSALEVYNSNGSVDSLLESMTLIGKKEEELRRMRGFGDRVASQNTQQFGIDDSDGGYEDLPAETAQKEVLELVVRLVEDGRLRLLQGVVLQNLTQKADYRILDAHAKYVNMQDVDRLIQNLRNIAAEELAGLEEGEEDEDDDDDNDDDDDDDDDDEEEGEVSDGGSDGAQTDEEREIEEGDVGLGGDGGGGGGILVLEAEDRDRVVRLMHQTGVVTSVVRRKLLRLLTERDPRIFAAFDVYESLRDVGNLVDSLQHLASVTDMDEETEEEGGEGEGGEGGEGGGGGEGGRGEGGEGGEDEGEAEGEGGGGEGGKATEDKEKVEGSQDCRSEMAAMAAMTSTTEGHKTEDTFSSTSNSTSSSTAKDEKNDVDVVVGDDKDVGVSNEEGKGKGDGGSLSKLLMKVMDEKGVALTVPELVTLQRCASKEDAELATVLRGAVVVQGDDAAARNELQDSLQAIATRVLEGEEDIDKEAGERAKTKEEQQQTEDKEETGKGEPAAVVGAVEEVKTEAEVEDGVEVDNAVVTVATDDVPGGEKEKGENVSAENVTEVQQEKEPSRMKTSDQEEVQVLPLTTTEPMLSPPGAAAGRQQVEGGSS